MKIDELIEKYIKLRDKKAEVKAAYDAEVDKIDAVMDKIEVAILQLFEATGQNSANTDAGTAYRTVKASCSVADKDAFLSHVRENDAWELTDIRVSKTGVDQYRSVHNELPPGVNWREVVSVNVNRPKK